MQQFLEGIPGLDRVQAASDIDGAIRVMAECGMPCLAVVDSWLAQGTMGTLLAQIRRLSPATRVLVVSGDDNPAVFEQACAAGIDGFLHKKEEPAVVRKAVLAVLDGGRWFADRGEAEGGAWLRDVPVMPEQLDLTPRQAHTLQLMLQGLSNKRIAAQLSLSEATVKEYVTAVLRKLKVNSRIEAITQLRGRRLVLPASEDQPGAESGGDNQR